MQAAFLRSTRATSSPESCLAWTAFIQSVPGTLWLACQPLHLTARSWVSTQAHTFLMPSR